jgi:prepilin signal peptidase PulO-like enzyme (type II secretory pathway)
VLANISFALLLSMAGRIAHHDFKTHFIRDLDLVLLLLCSTLVFRFNIYFAFLYLTVLLSVNLFSKGSIGFGDVKLGFILGSSIQEFMQFAVAIDAAWIIGGLWGLLRRKVSIPFAPAMILGCVISQLFIAFS